jgi:prepilin-type N-terminal cleavage/methylation domain-containing protein
MNNRKAFTIVELLIVVTIIALLLGILLPSITMVRTKAKETAQKAQFATIDMALEAFKQDYGDYPPSDMIEDNPLGRPYCGAQKLTEALLGWDLAGFHPKTSWRRDGYTGTVVPIGGIDSYDPCRADGTRTLTERKGPYLEVAKTPVFRLGTSSSTANDGLYNLTGSAIFDATLPNYVICDVFGVEKLTIAKSGGQTVNVTAGTPVLYYKANTSSKILTCPLSPLQAKNSIYNYTDNIDLLNLGILPKPDPVNRPHRLATLPPGIGRYFCSTDYKIVDQKVPAISATQSWPNRPDTYILISAGADHEFGTNDDILNF